MSLLGMTTAIILVASSGTTSLETTATTDAARIATNAGFLLGNAHRCGVATDRVVKAGQTIRELIKATAKDDKEQQEATDRFATFFLLTALPDRLSGHRLAGRAQDNARARAALNELGLNPLMVEAFRDRANSP